MSIDLVIFELRDFDVTFGVDGLYKYRATIDYGRKSIFFQTRELIASSLIGYLGVNHTYHFYLSSVKDA